MDSRPTIGGFALDERVRITQNHGQYNGRTATVMTLDHDHGYRLWVIVSTHLLPLNDPAGVARYVDPDDLEHVTPPAVDKLTATVIRKAGAPTAVRVESPDGDEWFFFSPDVREARALVKAGQAESFHAAAVQAWDAEPAEIDPALRAPEDPQGLRTPALVREFLGRKIAIARGELSTDVQHRWHNAVVDELRSRGVLD